MAGEMATKQQSVMTCQESESELQGADPPGKGMLVLSMVRQRGSNSGLGAVTKGTPLRAVLSHPIPALAHQPGRENRAQSCKALSRHLVCGLPTTPTSPTSPSANNSCLTTGPSDILAMCARHVSLAALRRCMS
eukprot:365313-Chlamydomonas_euryale.AAC.28